MQRFLLRLNILLSFTLLFSVLGAQVRISGTIMDFDTREPVDSARITLELPGFGVILDAWSDSLGRYEFIITQRIADGDYPLSIRGNGKYDLSGIVFITNGAIRNFFLRKRAEPERPWQNTVTYAEPPVRPAEVPVAQPVAREPSVKPVVEEPVVQPAEKDLVREEEQQRILAEVFRKQQLEKEEKKDIPASPQNFDDILTVPVEKGAVIRVDKVYFNANATFLRPDSYAQLDRVVEFLKSNPNIKIEVAGHTNSLCDDDFCLYLSDGRAKSVKDYLVSKGISASKVTHKGYGKQFPVADEKSPDGRALNQRVELKIIEVN